MQIHTRIIPALALVTILLFAGCAGRRIDPVAQARVGSVQSQILDIEWALVRYHADHGFWPEDFQPLLNEEYMIFYPRIAMEWKYSFTVGQDRLLEIEAVSLPDMTDGAGWKVVYNLQNGTWSGYEITEFP